MNNKKKKEFDAQLAELTEFAEKIQLEAKAEICHTEESYETYRDSYRFMIKVTFISLVISSLLLASSLAIFFTKAPGKSYITSRDGDVVLVKPIAVR